jgi:hypothetical protein
VVAVGVVWVNVHVMGVVNVTVVSGGECGGCNEGDSGAVMVASLLVWATAR